MKFECDTQFIEEKKIKIIGFKCSEAKIFTDNILIKLSKYTFPSHWERVFELLDDKDGLIVNDI
jgi:hypothetical protein